MDTTDTAISFDENGVCNHCHHFDEAIAQIVFMSGEEKARLLSTCVHDIKKAGMGREYDCVVGMSGGVDSSYLAYLAVKLGLRPLAVHVDGGWNSELAVNNIENMVKKLGIDLVTYVVDWNEMRDLQLSFFKASVANCDIPQDHAFVAAVYRITAEKNIKYILSGVNYATEGIFTANWGGYTYGDLRHILAIHKEFGTVELKSYPTTNLFQKMVYYPRIKRIKSVMLLNYINYDKNESKRILERELDWRDYGGKHYESILTRFLQEYYFIVKCGFDKRIVHLSDLIHSGQMSRQEALDELAKPLGNERSCRMDKEFIAKKMGMSLEDFEAILNRPYKAHSDYHTNAELVTLISRVHTFAYHLKRLITR
jgi:N-acetyl sugar amidotransferase